MYSHTHTHILILIQLAVRAVPYHVDFLAILGSDGSEEANRQVLQDLTESAQNLGEICVVLNEFLVSRNIETEQ